MPNSKRAGRCIVHDDLAWEHANGAVTCMYCLSVEKSSRECVVEALPPEWLRFDEDHPA